MMSGNINQLEVSVISDTSVMVVDDTAENLRVLEHMLTECGYHVRPASSGIFALKSVQAALPDLILLDIKMPGMTGYEVCAALKADERTRKIPIIFISALDDLHDKITAFQVGGVDYITKPFQHEEVLARVRTHIMLHHLHRQVETQNRRLQQLNDELEHRVTQRTAELIKAKEQAEIANLAKSHFLSSVSHELRTPLNNILGFTQILGKQLAERMNDTQKKHWQYIQESGERLLRLINDVLDISRIELNDIRLTPSIISLGILLEQSMTAIRGKDLKPQLTLALDIPPELRDLNIAIDVPKFKQIMFNLLSNAIKFTADDGTIMVDVRQKEEIVIISVQDNGIGIAKESQERIFEPFYQVQGGLVAKTPGTGLGLTLAQRLIQLLGGTIWVESEGIGTGSRFNISLPIFHRKDAEAQRKKKGRR